MGIPGVWSRSGRFELLDGGFQSRDFHAQRSLRKSLLRRQVTPHRAHSDDLYEDSIEAMFRVLVIQFSDSASQGLQDVYAVSSILLHADTAQNLQEFHAQKK